MFGASLLVTRCFQNVSNARDGRSPDGLNAKRKLRLSGAFFLQGRQDSNLQPTVLETGGFRLSHAVSGGGATVGATVPLDRNGGRALSHPPTSYGPETVAPNC